MKKVLLTLLAVIVIAGVLAGVGLAGYRIGYQRGAFAADTNISAGKAPFMHPDIPMHNFGRGFDRNFNRGFRPDGFGMRGGMGFGFFSPLMFLGRILFWGLIIWFAYWLITRSGWQLTRKPQPVAESPKAEAAPVEAPTHEEKEE